MRGIPIVPGVPAAGHVSVTGWWHPGRADGCVKCEPPTPPTCNGSRRSQTGRRATASEGSDCKTGKIQYVTRDAALAAARSVKDRRSLQPFRCAWCGCFHNGNRRGEASKARAR
jgi:hypothetical protein